MLFLVLSAVTAVTSPVLAPRVAQALLHHQPHLQALFYPVLLCTVLTYAMLILGETLTHTPAAPLGQVSVQLAMTSSALVRMFQSWTPPQRLAFAFDLGVDVYFAFFYGLFLAITMARVGHKSPTVVSLPLYAAMFDFAEGFFILHCLMMPFDAITDAHAATISLLAASKFACIVASLFFIVQRGVWQQKND